MMHFKVAFLGLNFIAEKEQAPASKVTSSFPNMIMAETGASKDRKTFLNDEKVKIKSKPAWCNRP